MNREIKFRAWREKDYNGTRFQIARGMYMVGNLPLWTLAEMDFGLEVYIKHAPETRYHDRNIKDYILMQFTGLKDKNGKEIYEGDIVRADGQSMRVVWFSLGACFRYAPDDKNLESVLNYDDIEVIGNTYESPSLLKPDQPNTDK